MHPERIPMERKKTINWKNQDQDFWQLHTARHLTAPTQCFMWHVWRRQKAIPFLFIFGWGWGHSRMGVELNTNCRRPEIMLNFWLAANYQHQCFAVHFRQDILLKIVVPIRGATNSGLRLVLYPSVEKVAPFDDLATKQCFLWVYLFNSLTVML